MRQLPYYIFISLVLLHCTTSPKPIENSEPLPPEVDTVEKKDGELSMQTSGETAKTDSSDTGEWRFPERLVYSVNTLSDGADLNISFISLTDAYNWPDDSDSMIIEDKFLLKPAQSKYSLHTIGPEKRATFLKRVGIKETDSVFIYFLKDHRMERYAVKDMPLTGMLSPYVSDSDFPVPEHYYMIGFNLNTTSVSELMTYVRTCLVSISATNPFNVGGSEHMEFQQITKAEFPDTTVSHDHKLHAFYFYSNEYYDYYVHDRGEDYLRDRRIMVQSKLDGQIEFDKWYMAGEGTEINPIYLNEESYGGGMWTGKLFKSKPFILMGMQSQSFGCPSIDLIGSDESIYIHCDNRH